jgi:hypothetical protein
MRAVPGLLAVLALVGCAGAVKPRAPTLVVRPPSHNPNLPAFLARSYEPFSRSAAVAIALREWRLFGQPVDDDPPGTRPPPLPEDKPEREQGLWQRVGEYWFLSQDPSRVEAAWTGKHDENGNVFDASIDGQYAWSAAFISYVMRIAGAGDRFPYSPAHHDYIDAARDVSLAREHGTAAPTWAVSAERIDAYAPQPGDLICTSRTRKPMTFDDLPAGDFAAHCDIVVAEQPGTLSVIGGNVDDAVTMKHVPVTPDGHLAPPGGPALDDRYNWFVVLKVLYETP